MMYGLDLIRTPSQSLRDSSPEGGAKPTGTSLAPLPLPLGEVSAPALTERVTSGVAASGGVRPAEGGIMPFQGMTLDEVRTLRQEVADLRAMLVAQNSLLEQVAQALSTTRVSRSQERTLRDAVHERAGYLREREGLPAAAGRMLSAAILGTLRQLTGCRALGDVPAVKYDQCLEAVRAWDMTGAIRKIRRGLNDER